MKKRHFWQEKIEAAWHRRPVIWLSGVRRVGKTTLCHSLPDIEYFDCELPRTRQRMEDVEAFLKELKGKRVVLDEAHRLHNPSELLKIAADHFPDVHILATGSSTLGASAKFRDTLTGRKAHVWLTPMILDDLDAFGSGSLAHRLLRGGLPPFFLSEAFPEVDFQEWIDAYWAKDILELFRLERRHSFQRFFELVMSNSGGIFEATRFARPCEVSRTTISNYLAVLEATHVAHVVRPFASNPSTEIVSAPKVYAFDTGFFCYFRGWRELRTDDMGILWEHMALNEMHALQQNRDIRYWRDKRGHEVDFVLPKRGTAPDVIECKWQAKEFSPRALLSFRRRYPGGNNIVLANDVDEPFVRMFGALEVRFAGLRSIASGLV